MFIVTTALLHLLLLNSVNSLEREVVLNSELNTALEGFTYKDFTATDLWGCFRKCLDEGLCQSINFDLLFSYCEFNKDIKKFNPSKSRERYLGVYMENPKRAKKGSLSFLPARSCKEIKDIGEDEGDGEYWIDPEKTGNPFTVFCDMKTDSGGWTLVKRTKLQTTTPPTDRVDVNDYKGITNYTNNQVYILVPAIQKLRDVTGFHQIRWRCHKKSLGRTLHIMTTNDSAGQNVLRHFLETPNLRPPACNSYVRLPDDNSILAQNCLKWGNTGSSGGVEVNKWGRYSNEGDWRIYNNAIVWESKHYLTFISDNYFCDDLTGATYGALSIGDQWEIFVR